MQRGEEERRDDERGPGAPRLLQVLEKIPADRHLFGQRGQQKQCDEIRKHSNLAGVPSRRRGMSKAKRALQDQHERLHADP